MVFEDVALWVLEFVNWGVTILVIMGLWEVWKFATFETKTGEKVGETAGAFGSWLQKKNPYSSEGQKARKVERDAKREKTKLLNEFIEEKKELELLEAAKNAADRLVAKISSLGAVVIPVRALSRDFRELKDKIEAAGREVARLKRATFRQERQSKKLIEDLQDAEVDIKEINKVKAKENDILKEHDELVRNFNSLILASFRKVRTEFDPAGNINDLKRELETLSGELDNIITKIKKSYEEVEGLIADFQKYWKQ